MFFTALSAYLNWFVAMPVRNYFSGFLFMLLALPALNGAAEFTLADRVIISKSERKLLLMKDDSVLRTFDVSLGLLPQGDKTKEGDFRTPEGRHGPAAGAKSRRR